MKSPAEKSQEESIAGLCATCQHARRIESARGSVFFLCQVSATDPHFPKYPRLPVTNCSGYSRRLDEEKVGESGNSKTS